jgi:hypothetical protein
MTLSLTILFIHLIAPVRSPQDLAAIMPEPPWPWLVVSLVLLSASVLVGRRFRPPLPFRLQRRAVR